MGMVHANITIQNGFDVEKARYHEIGEDQIRQIEVTALVDTGALMLAINEDLRVALGLPIIDYRPSQLADGTRLKMPVAGSVVVRFEDRFCTTNAFVLPGDSEPLLGAIPMEEMDLWINPQRQQLTGAHPDGLLLSLK